MSSGSIITVPQLSDAWARDKDWWRDNQQYEVARGGADANVPLDFLLAAGVPIVALGRPGHELAARLMRRYRNVPMDYADATLVVVAEALRTRKIFTLDRRGFSTYRRRDGQAFTLCP